MESLPGRGAVGGLCLAIAACTAGQPAEQPVADDADSRPTRSEPSRDRPSASELPTPSPSTQAPPDQAGASLVCAERHLTGMDRRARAAQLVMIGVPADSAAVPDAAAGARRQGGGGGARAPGRTA